MDTPQSNTQTNYLTEIVVPVGLVILGYLISEVRAWVQRRRDRSKEKRAYKSLLGGLRAEVDHTINVIVELTNIVQNGKIPAKRISADALGDYRLTVPNHDTDRNFLLRLTTAYTDVIVTNTQLEALQASLRPKATNALAALHGVSDSVNLLSEIVDTKLKLLQKS